MRTVFFTFSRNEHYRDCATDCEALSVQRNARRWIKVLTKFGVIAAGARSAVDDPTQGIAGPGSRAANESFLSR